MALRHIWGHFARGQLAYPLSSWASPLGSLPVLSAHCLASNFLNQQKGENGRRIFFMTKSPRKNMPRPSAYQAVRASDWASTPRPSHKDILKIVEWMGTFSSETSANRHNSGKFETLIALQNDLRWFLQLSWLSKSGGGPRITLQEEILGLILLSNLCATPPRRHPHLILTQKRCYLLW